MGLHKAGPYIFDIFPGNQNSSSFSGQRTFYMLYVKGGMKNVVIVQPPGVPRT